MSQDGLKTETSGLRPTSLGQTPETENAVKDRRTRLRSKPKPTVKGQSQNKKKPTNVAMTSLSHKEIL